MQNRRRILQWVTSWTSPMTLLLLLLIALFPAYAQLPTATVLGVVKDSSGAIVPGANISARNTETGQVRSSVTGQDGSYRLAALQVGSYEVRAEHPGFQTAIRTGLTLAVTQEAVVNFTLEVGGIEQTVSVTADAPLVNTTSGVLGGLVDEKKMAELPLNGRNFVDLAFLQPGIQRDPTSKSGGPIMRGDWFSSNGTPGRSNNFLLDGAMMSNLNGNSPATNADWSPGVEGIREFRVVSNSFSAEYGMKMGSQVMIVSKGGTNSLHGSLFEYFRNSVMDARNFFDRKTTLTPDRLPNFVRNNFGGSVGGAIRRDKLFYFTVYEALKDRLGTTQVASVIPLAAKAGAVDPAIRPFLQFYPDPNLPGDQFTYSPVQPTNGQYGQQRIDYNLSASDSMFGRYTIQDTDLVLPTVIPRFGDDRTGRAQFATLSENHIFSPALLNTARFSYSRTNDIGRNLYEPSGAEFTLVPGLNMGLIQVGGIATIGPSGVNPVIAKQNVFTWSDDIFYTHGSHSLKFGTLINRYQQYSLTSTQVRGQLVFANLQAFLNAGPLVSYTAVTPGSTIDRSWEFTTLGFYAQDDYRVHSNLTLNLGLRYEFHTTFHETRDKGSSLRDIVKDTQFTVGPLFKNPSRAALSPRFGFAWDVFGNGRTAVRGGFAVLYDVAVGIGGAIITTTGLPPFASTSAVSASTRGGSLVDKLRLPLFFPPESAGKTIRPLQWNAQNPHLLQYSLTMERQLPYDMGLTLSYSGTRGLNLLYRYEGNPTTPQILADGRKFWTGTETRRNPAWDSMEFKDTSGSSWYNGLQVTLAKRLTHGLQFQNSYTWSKAMDLGQSQLGTSEDSAPPDPQNLRLEKAPMRSDATHNVRFSAIYQLPNLVASSGLLSKLTNGWGISSIVALQSGFPFSTSVTSNRSRSQATIGTQAANSDRPDIISGRNNENITKGTSTGCATNVANRPIAAGTKLGTPDLYFDPCAFSLQPLGFLGNAGRNILRGPGVTNVDLSFVKNTAVGLLGEAGKIEFRAELFNILNRANFASKPNSSVFAGTAADTGVQRLSTAGLIQSTSTTSRQIQLALKLIF